MLQRKGKNDADKTFTLRKISSGTAVERIFPIASPIIHKIDIIREGIVRRAKLFYLRDKKGKNAKIKHREGISRASKASKPAPSAPTL